MALRGCLEQSAGGVLWRWAAQLESARRLFASSQRRSGGLVLTGGSFTTAPPSGQRAGGRPPAGDESGFALPLATHWTKVQFPARVAAGMRGGRSPLAIFLCRMCKMSKECSR
jgi:hypothetical protein